MHNLILQRNIHKIIKIIQTGKAHILQQDLNLIQIVDKLTEIRQSQNIKIVKFHSKSIQIDIIIMHKGNMNIRLKVTILIIMI